jgi:hypothetical protein
MTLDSVYPRLLDAVVTEWTNGMTSRQEVREALEEALDGAQPRERRAETWGSEMTAEQWEQLLARSKAGRATAAVDAGGRSAR